VIELIGSGQTIMRIDLPTVIEEDDDGQYPLVQAHDRNYDPPLPAVDAISVTMRHRSLDG
jgi:hypothetical protein